MLEYGKPLPERHRKGGSVPVVGSAGVVGFHNEALIDGPALIVGRKGTAGNVFQLEDSCWPIDTTFYVRVLDPTRLSLAFAQHLLEHANLHSIATATGVPGLTRDRAYELLVSLPPLSQQRRITDLIGTVDRARRAAELEQKSARDVARALTNEALTRLRAPTALLGDHAEVKGGKRLPNGHPFSDVPTPYAYLRVVDFIDHSIAADNRQYLSREDGEFLSRYTISSDDVYISIVGTIGRVGRVPLELSGSNLTENAAKIVVDDPAVLDPDFLVAFLASDIGRSEIASRTVKTSQPKLALKRIRTLELPLPTLEEQAAIARRHQAAVAVNSLADASEQGLHRLRSSLLQALLTDEHDIPESYDSFL